MNSPRASALVRTFNSIDTIAGTIESLRSQDVDVEIVVIDSGSTDGTLEYVEGRVDQLLQIPTAEFTYGGSLNTAAAAATTPVHVALSGHCTLPHAGWVRTAAEHIEGGAVAAFGARRLWDGTVLTGAVELTHDDLVQDRFWGFSNHASAWSARAWAREPFRADLPSSEDREWSWRVARTGHLVADPALLVSGVHRRSAGAKSYFRRLVKEGTALLEWRTLPDYPLRHALRDLSVTAPETPLVSTARRFGRTRAIEVAARYAASRRQARLGFVHRPDPAPADWGRAEWEALADRLLDAVEPHRSPSGSLVIPPGPLAPRRGAPGIRQVLRSAQTRAEITLGRPGGAGVLSANGLEGFARTSLLAAYRARHADPSRRDELLERVRRGLLAGTDPAHDERWPVTTDRAQGIVESAVLVLALHHSREHLWDRLTTEQQDQVATWLRGAAEADVLDNNWHVFCLVVENFLASVGRPVPSPRAEEHAAAVERMYRGDGWYTDGGERNFDYYNGWGFHLYLVEAASIAGDETALKEHLDRLRIFTADAVDLVDGRGAPVYFGRSLTYRHAVLTPLWLSALHGVSPIDPATTRRTASRVAQFFAASGAPDADGLLPLGWTAAEPAHLQVYSGSASPYWAAKGFMGLLIDPADPVWTTGRNPEDTGGLAGSSSSRTMPVPGLMVHGSSSDQVVRMLNHGSQHWLPELQGSPHHDPLYDAFAYSSCTLPPAGGSLASRPIANQLVVTVGGRSHPRVAARPLEAAGGAIRSVHDSPLGPIITTSVVHDAWEIRWHRFPATVPGAAAVTVAAGGYPARSDSSGVSLADCGAVVSGAGAIVSLVRGLVGWTGVEVRNGRTGIGRPRTGVPVLLHEGPLPAEGSLVMLVALAEHPRAADLARASRRARAEIEDGTCHFTFPDGVSGMITA